MAAQGATLQNYNNELVKCVDDLKEKREEVNKAILKDVRRAERGLRPACSRFAASAARRGVGLGEGWCPGPHSYVCGLSGRRRRRRTRSRMICGS